MRITMIRYGRRTVALAVALSALAGYVDASGFLSTGNFFVSFMSGNSTRLAIGLEAGRWWYGFLTLGVVGLFVLGVVAGSLLSHYAKERRKAAVLGLVCGLLACAAVAYSLQAMALSVAAMLLAMGAENTVFQREGEVSIGVTYMTGTLVKLGQRVAAIAHGGPIWAWFPYFLLWAGLVMGAVLGAFVHGHYAAIGLWAGAAYALGLAFYAARVLTPA